MVDVFANLTKICKFSSIRVAVNTIYQPFPLYDWFYYEIVEKIELKSVKMP